LTGWPRSLKRTGLHRRFPGNREKYRENHEPWPVTAPVALKSAHALQVLTGFSLNNRTGNYSLENRAIILGNRELAPALSDLGASQASLAGGSSRFIRRERCGSNASRIQQLDGRVSYTHIEPGRPLHSVAAKVHPAPLRLFLIQRKRPYVHMKLSCLYTSISCRPRP